MSAGSSVRSRVDPGSSWSSLSFGGAGRLSTIARDAWWYPFALGRAARRLDVLHCTTFRAPRRVAGAARRHRPRPRPAPSSGGLSHLDRRTGASRCVPQSAPPTRSSPSRSSRATSSSSCSPCRPTAFASCRTASTRLHARTARRRGELRARGRDARAAQEPRRGGRGRAARRRRAARRSARAGWGGVDVPAAGSDAVGRGAGGALPRRALPRLPVAVRGLRHPGARGDGLRDARGDEPRQRHGGGRGRRGGARRPDRPGRHRGRASREASAARRARAARARACPRVHLAACGRPVEALWRELA